MKVAIEIVQQLVLPKLKKDILFDIKRANTAFWEDFTRRILDLETNAQPLYALIYSLELQDAEKLISKLDSIYIDLLKELAELHVLGTSSDATDYLITSKNKTFEKEVSFYTDLKNAITKIERKRIKQQLPKGYDKLTFELSDDAIALAIKKKEREALKEKMKVWDKELALSEETPVYSIAPKKSTKFISFYFTKYAATVCVYLSVSIQYYNIPYNSIDSFVETENSELTVQGEPNTPSNTSIPCESLVEVTTVTKTAPVMVAESGFASNNVKIVENNLKARKLSIERAIEKYRQMLEKEFPDNKIGYGTRAKAIQDTITSLQKELALLNDKEKHYEFDGKALVLYVSDSTTENTIVFYEDTYYLRRKTTFYKLTIASQPQLYKKEGNSDVLNKLDKIYNGY